MTTETAPAERLAPAPPRAAFEAIFEGDQALRDGLGHSKAKRAAEREAEAAEREAEAAESYRRGLDAFSRARGLAPHIVAPHLGMGHALFELERFDQARSSFERALRIEADNVDAEWGVAKALLRLDRSSEALPRLERVTELQPAFAPAWLQLAETLEALGKQDEALTVLGHAFERNLEDAGICLAYGKLLQDVDRQSEAVEAFRRAKKLGSATEDLWRELEADLSMGGALLQSDRPEDALLSFQAVSDKSERLSGDVAAQASEAASYGLGAVALQLGRHDEALNQFERVAGSGGRLALYALYAQVALMRSLGEFSRAWTVLSSAKSVAEDSVLAGASLTDPEFARHYGFLLRLLGERRKAIEIYQRAMTCRSPLQEAAHKALSLHYELIAAHLERPEDRVADEFSSDVEIHNEAQHLGRARREFKLAEANCQRALNANRSAKNLIGVAALRMLLGHHEQARSLLLEAIRLGEGEGISGAEQGVAHAYLGTVHLRAGESAPAAKSFKAALQYEPENLGYQLGASEAYLRLGQLELAKRNYSAILDVAPDMVEAHIGLAETLTAQGDEDHPEKYEQAVAEFAEAIHLGIGARPEMPERKGSRPLNAREVAMLHYATGYALTRLYEIDTARELRRRAASWRLSKATDAFKHALDADPSHRLAAQAIERIQSEKRLRRSRETFATLVPLLLVAAIIGLLLLVQLAFFTAPVRDGLPKGFRDDLNPTTYSVLVFGLLVFLIAAISLPQLLKLQVAGVALEKAPLEPAQPAQLGIGQEHELECIVSIELASAPEFEKPRPSSESPVEQMPPKPSGEPIVGRRDAQTSAQKASPGPHS